MFASRFSVQLKPNKLAEFTKTLENEILPLLRKQEGFSDEIVFAKPNGTDIQAISLWATQQNAETYDGGAYKDVLKLLENVMVGAPKVGITEVVHSTFQPNRPSIAAA
jgi:hypothetical protein